MTDNVDELEDTMPQGLDDPTDGNDWDEDDEELYINFSDEEAASKALEPLPSGKYNVQITKIETRASKSEKNNGKPYWNLTMKIVDGKYAKRTVFANVMLWSGAAYSLNQLMNACGFPTQTGQVKVPGRQAFIGKTLTIRGMKRPARTVGDKTYDESFEVKGYMALSGAGGADDLEP